MFLPIQDSLHCNENEAEQTLYALIGEGEIEEFEKGKFRPTEKLRGTGGE
jgi:hypothetical protein